MPKTPPNPAPRSSPLHGAPDGEEEFTWLVSTFVSETPGVEHAAVVSSDGVPMTASREFPKQHVEHLSAIVSGLHSLATGATQTFDKGATEQVLLRMEHGYLVVMGISDGSSLAVLTSTDADMKVVGHQMTRLVEGAAHVLTPQVRDQLVTPHLPGRR